MSWKTPPTQKIDPRPHDYQIPMIYSPNILEKNIDEMSRLLAE